ncbi:hypothetical protein F5Y19DRAFT_493414 [Xylariaceae sp. FL1651]|nr:hypothetical protein F5Y19DRAFT_493414 [Xylariaceae sp. FL1651]
MGTPATSGTVPLSPWAKRFAIEDGAVPQWDNVTHSGYAPEFPKINNPIYYIARPTGNFQIPQNNADWDKLFYTEEYQTTKFSGFRTWQVAALNRWVRFSPQTGYISGGHLPNDVGPTEIVNNNIWQQYRIKVDEKNWLPFLRKDRWHDWTETSPPAKQATGRIWSVDDPKVWEHLSISLELTNRILQALIEDKSEPDSRVLLSYTVEQLMAQKRGKPFEWAFIAQQTKDQWRDRLTRLLSKLAWGFVDTKGVAEAQTITSTDLPNHTALCQIDSERMRVLCDMKITLAERCMMQVNMAVSIVHELVHAILAGRVFDDVYVGNRLQKDAINLPEPFYDCYGIAEAGLSMEQFIFGGMSTIQPSPDIPISWITFNFPNTLYQIWNAVPGKWQEIGEPMICGLVPATWTSKILSEAFWQDPAYPQKSANFFHRNPVFTSTSANTTGTRQWVTTQAIDLSTLPQAYDEDNMAVRAWTESHQLWNNLRAGWYDIERFDWSNVLFRRSLHSFTVAFEEKDEITCAKTANALANSINWRQDQATFFSGFPGKTNLSSAWIYYAIGMRNPNLSLYDLLLQSLRSLKKSDFLGLLMMAALPIRKSKVEKTVKEADWAYKAVPSREAVAAGWTSTIQLTMADPAKTSDVEASELYNQFSGHGKVDEFSQLDYLELVFRLQDSMSIYTPLVQLPFMVAIRQAFNALQIDRRSLRASYPDAHATKWASVWPFDLPEYQKRLGTWDQSTQTWRDMRFDPGTGQWVFL